MSEQIVNDYQIISTKQLVKAVKEGRSNHEKFCFILGSGASVSSGIPSGTTLERNWMEEMEKDPGLDEVCKTAKQLKNSKKLKYEFNEIKNAWEKLKDSSQSLPSKYYFDIYKLRFFPNYRNGYHYIEKIMSKANPSFGYHTLALMLTDGTGSNLVITTNFDSLTEDALFLYTDKKPLVINHELLAEYAGDANIQRPIIAKVHRGLFFDPLNQPQETNKLKKQWYDVLGFIFQSYTPIVIGYGGGDDSLMGFLENENIKMKNGIYWCYYDHGKLPNDRIKNLIKDKNGWLVSTAGFDAVMLALGNALFGNEIVFIETAKYLTSQTNTRIAKYAEEYDKLIKFDNLNGNDQSGEEFKKDIEKIEKRSANSEKERMEKGNLTEWDYWRQGNRFYNLKQYEDAIKSYSKAIEIQPNTAAFYNNRGNAYSNTEEYDKAIKDYNQAVELNPKYAEAFNNRGNAYRYLGEHDKAIEDYNQAIELNPKLAEAFNNRGIAYCDTGEYDKAAKDYNQAIELNPKDAGAFFNRGLAYCDTGKYDKAIENYNQAVELNPKLAEALINRGNVYRCLGEYDQAIEDYSQAIELNPKDAEAFINRGCAYSDKGEYDKAIEDYSQAIELNPKYKDAYVNRAKAYRSLGDIAKATADEEISVKL